MNEPNIGKKKSHYLPGTFAIRIVTRFIDRVLSNLYHMIMRKSMR